MVSRFSENGCWPGIGIKRGDLLPIRLGIVGSLENDSTGRDVSLAKFLATGTVEVFCLAPEYIDFSQTVGKFSVGVYLVRLDRKTPATSGSGHHG